MGDARESGPDFSDNQQSRSALPVKWSRRSAAAVVLLTLALIAVMTLLCLRRTDGTLVYALDDAYIHLALARTLAEHGVLGVTAQTPAAASSSPLWTLMLTALAALGGSSIYHPLVLNALAASALVLLADIVLRDQFEVSTRWRIVIVVAVLAVGPVVPLVIVGMEHVAHAAAVLALVWYALRSDRPSAPILFALAFLAVGLRYESGFVVIGLTVALLMRRRWSQALAVAVGGITLIVGVGLYQLQMGQHFLPNSLLVKGVPDAGVVELLRLKLSDAVAHARAAPLSVLVASTFMAATFVGFRRTVEGRFLPRDRAAIEWTMVFAAAVMIHWLIARLGWYARYEAYLIILGVVLLGGLLGMALRGAGSSSLAIAGGADYRRAWIMALMLMLVATGLIMATRLSTYASVAAASGNIYEQQYQMARFVSRYYPRETIVINDIGYVAYLHEGEIVDLWGLATIEVADAMRADEVDADFVGTLAHERGAPIAITYELEFIPDTWEKIATWTVRNPKVVYSPTVHFYAVQPGAAGELEANLRDFEQDLPAGVTVQYITDGEQ